MLKDASNQFAVPASLAISVGMAVIPYIFESSSKTKHSSQEAFQPREDKTAQPHVDGSTESSVDGSTESSVDSIQSQEEKLPRKEENTLLDNIGNLLLERYSSFIMGGSSKCCGLKGLLETEFPEDDNEFECVVASPGVLRKDFQMIFGDYLKIDDERSEPLQIMEYTKGWSFNAPLNCALRAAQCYLAGNCSRHRHDDISTETGTVTGTKESTDCELSEGCSTLPEVIAENVSSLNSSNPSHTPSSLQPSQRIVFEETGITERSGQLQYFRDFQRLVSMIMKIFLMGTNCDGNSLTSFAQRLETEIPRGLILEISTCDRASCELRISNVRDSEIDITVSLPLKFLQETDKTQDIFKVGDIQNGLLYFLGVVLDYLLSHKER